MITDRENILRMYHGEMPEFLPRFGMANARCSYFPNVKLPGYHVDEFGVEYIGKECVFDGTPIPYPGRYILHDIRELFSRKKLTVTIRGKKAPVLGHIGMLHCVVDVTGIQCEVGDEVRLDVSPIFANASIERVYM